jgi:hypothetical protein
MHATAAAIAATPPLIIRLSSVAAAVSAAFEVSDDERMRVAPSSSKKTL